MGSGLILLVIVGAWLAVLVPLGLRAHDLAVPEEHTGDPRVLRRRDRAEVPAVPDAEPRGVPLAALRQLWSSVVERGAARPAPSPAARRRRVLLGLVLVALACGGLGLVGPSWLLWVASGAVGLAALFVARCRQVQRLRAAACRAGGALQVLVPAQRSGGREVVPAQGATGHDVPVGGALPSAAPVLGRQARLTHALEHGRDPLPTYEPALYAPAPAPLLSYAPAPVSAPLPSYEIEPATSAVPAAPATYEPERGLAAGSRRYPQPLLAAQGAPWQPVPVPPPLYVGKAVAPRRRPVAPPVAWTEDLYADAPQREEHAHPAAVAEPRRAVGDW